MGSGVMTAIHLTNRIPSGSTVISNDFIDHDMTDANGEFVKIYLYLLRWSQDTSADISSEKMADIFCLTENDVLRALLFWEKKGLLALSWDQGTLCQIELKAPDASAAPPRENHPVPRDTAGNSPIVKPTYPMSEINDFMDHQNGDQLIFIIQQYMGRPLSQPEMNTIVFFYKDLGFSTDLIEYLFEYCISGGHRKFSYIETVAISWKEDHIDTVEQAKERSMIYNQLNQSVIKAFGISGRFLADEELKYIRRWNREYGFTQDIITEACRRTIQNTHAASFKYADSILTRWHDQKVSSMQDIKALDTIHEKSRKKGGASSSAGQPKKPAPAPNRFTHFKQRTYDYDDIEKKLAEKLHASVRPKD